MLYRKWNGTQIDSAYKAFLNKFTFLYGKPFEKFVVTVKLKTLKNPWITKGTLRSSKTKQRLKKMNF